MTMADTIAVMNKGRIEQMGSPELLYELPRTAFVANFLGQSNLFTGPVVGETSTSIAVDVAGRSIVVPKARSHRHGGDVTIGVRPEKLSLHRDLPAPDSASNVLGPGRVTDVSFTGVSTQYLVAVPGLGTLVVFEQNRSAGPIEGEGDEVWVTWNVEHGFGLDDDPAEQADKFVADTTTQSLAAQRRADLLTELEEA